MSSFGTGRPWWRRRRGCLTSGGLRSMMGASKTMLPPRASQTSAKPRPGPTRRPSEQVPRQRVRSLRRPLVRRWRSRSSPRPKCRRSGIRESLSQAWPGSLVRRPYCEGMSSVQPGFALAASDQRRIIRMASRGTQCRAPSPCMWG